MNSKFKQPQSQITGPSTVGIPSCLVCCENIPSRRREKVFAIGKCNHPICYYCSTKMRVLHEKNECPICRTDLAQIIFVENAKRKFNEFQDLRRFCYNDKYMIYFETDLCFHVFNELVVEKCKKCNATFSNMEELNDHLWHIHHLLTCQLCLVNLKIFSEERKYYNSKQLNVHKLFGDQGDCAHKGHPVCQLCNQMLFDSEELNRHLRREHYYCHLCDDNKTVYYNKYETLNQHFRDEHFLCEEGPCKNEQFTSVFQSAIDLQAHKAQIHCLTKSEAKHARTLSIDLTFNPTSRGPRVGGFNPQVVASLNDDGFNSRSLTGGGRRGRGDRGDRGGGGDRNPPVIPEDVWMTEDFDNLGAVGPPQQLLRPEDFPSLGEPSRQGPPIRPDNPPPPPPSTSSRPTANRETTSDSSKTSKKPKQPQYSTKIKESATFGRKNDEEFPALCIRDNNGEGPSSYRPAPQIIPSTASISLADAVKLNAKPPDKITSQPVNGKAAKSTINSINRITNDLIDEPSTSQDFSLAQNDFPSLPFKVNGNRKKKKALNILLASLNLPQSNPPSNYTSVRLVDSLIPKENNGSTSNKSDADNGSSLEENMESLLLKEDNFPPLAGESSKLKSKGNKKESKSSDTSIKTKTNSGSTKSMQQKQQQQPSFSSLIRPPPGYEKRNPNKASSELSMKAVAEQVIKPKSSTITTNYSTNTNHLNIKKTEIHRDNHQTESTSNVSSSMSNDKTGNQTALPTLPNNQRKLKRENFDQPTSNDRINSKSAKQSSSSKSTASSSSPQSTSTTEKVSPNNNKHQNGTSNRSSHNHFEESPEYSYIYPKDFDERNRGLFGKVQFILKDRFKDFDSVSRAFFNDDIAPHQYYGKCCEMFRNKLSQVLLDLIVLLPDIRKQKHLMNAHEAALKQRSGTGPKRTGIWEIKTDSELDVVVCPMCGQVLAKKDGPDHITTHQKIKS